mmetsp:Transcript_10452/g.17316  ORF Transcript_10452/g.17316 Transcript_10452/m.17316 type:complete len:235 (-) Transcript_10452:53-757(-)
MRPKHKTSATKRQIRVIMEGIASLQLLDLLVTESTFVIADMQSRRAYITTDGTVKNLLPLLRARPLRKPSVVVTARLLLLVLLLLLVPPYQQSLQCPSTRSSFPSLFLQLFPLSWRLLPFGLLPLTPGNEHLCLGGTFPRTAASESHTWIMLSEIPCSISVSRVVVLSRATFLHNRSKIMVVLRGWLPSKEVFQPVGSSERLFEHTMLVTMIQLNYRFIITAAALVLCHTMEDA